MIEIKLPFPVYLEKQLQEISERTGLGRDDLEKILDESLFAAMDFGGGYSLTSPGEATEYTKTGTDGIERLCSIHSIDIRPVEKIELSLDVYYECCPLEWSDFCARAAEIESNCERYRKLVELKAPDIIIRAVSRQIRMSLERLEHNFPNDPDRQATEDGRVRRALNDIGYSLVDGWDAEMLEEFDRREREMQEEIEKNTHLPEEDGEE